MGATAERAPVRASRAAEIVVGFDAERVKAPFFLRCGALLTDYIVMVSVPVLALLLGRYLGNAGPVLLGGTLVEAGWLIAILIGFANLIILPMISGQSIGKMLTRLRIVRTDGSSATKRSIVLRQTLGYALSFATFGLGFLFALVDRRGRALHDFLSGTVVIFADRRIQ
jgi:uncharacterized RDD family membrane protein YckC